MIITGVSTGCVPYTQSMARGPKDFEWFWQPIPSASAFSRKASIMKLARNIWGQGKNRQH
jgi:hypothetical protein